MDQLLKNPLGKVGDARDRGFDLWVGKILWRRKWQPLKYSYLENSMDRGAWWATVRGVVESRTRQCAHTHTQAHTHSIWQICLSSSVERKKEKGKGGSSALCVCVCSSLSHVRLFVTPWTVACQAPLSLEFSRQEYWSALPFSSPEVLYKRKHIRSGKRRSGSP